MGSTWQAARTARRPPGEGRRGADWFHRPSALVRGLGHDVLVGHFLLSRTTERLPDSWSRRSRHGWYLAVESALPVADLVDANGRGVGWVLGQPIDVVHGRFVEVCALPVADDDAHFDRRLDEWAGQFGGRFAVIVTRGAGAVLPDAFASIPILYDAATESVSSSLMLLTSGNGSIRDSALVDKLAVYSTGTYFPLGLTPHATARLLLPSHRLDLRSFEASRIWPRSSFSAVDPDVAVSTISGIFRATLEAASAQGRASFALTAGGDSRTLLACSRSLRDRLHLFTIPHDDLTGCTDAKLARRLASSFDLDHRVLEWIPPSEDDVRLWMFRTGALSGESRGRLVAPTLRQLDPAPYVSGVGLEIGRGRKWRKGDQPEARVGARDLLGRLALPALPESVHEAERWLEQLPTGIAALDVIDLFYLEVRHGCWAGPLTLGYPERITTTIYPCGQRDVLELMLRLPWGYRGADRLRLDIMEREWPELLGFPVNSPSWYDDLRYRCRRLRGRPRGAVRRIRRALDRRRSRERR